MDVSAINSILTSYYSAQNSYQVDSSALAGQLASQILDKRDSDGDGYLTNEDLSELFSDNFKKLDTDSDGKIGADEIESAIATQIENLKLASQTGDQGALALLRNTAAGQLMQAARSSKHASSSSTTTQPASNALLDTTG